MEKDNTLMDGTINSNSNSIFGALAVKNGHSHWNRTICMLTEKAAPQVCQAPYMNDLLLTLT